MTKLRTPFQLDFHKLIVRPVAGFAPADWRSVPEAYSILSYEGPALFRGRVDAWRFSFNREVISSDSIDRWAIVCQKLESFHSRLDQRPIHNVEFERLAWTSDASNRSPLN